MSKNVRTTDTLKKCWLFFRNNKSLTGQTVLNIENSKITKNELVKLNEEKCYGSLVLIYL